MLCASPIHRGRRPIKRIAFPLPHSAVAYQRFRHPICGCHTVNPAIAALLTLSTCSVTAAVTSSAGGSGSSMSYRDRWVGVGYLRCVFLCGLWLCRGPSQNYRQCAYIFASRRFASVRLSLALRAAPRERRREAAVGSGLGVLGGLKKVGDSSGDTAGGEKGLSI